jgi:hypothetical protein
MKNKTKDNYKEKASLSASSMLKYSRLHETLTDEGISLPLLSRGITSTWGHSFLNGDSKEA